MESFKRKQADGIQVTRQVTFALSTGELATVMHWDSKALKWTDAIWRSELIRLWMKKSIMYLYCTAHRMHMNFTSFTSRAPKTRWISRIGPLPLLDQWVWLAIELRAQFAIGGLWVGMMLMLMVLLLVAVAVICGDDDCRSSFVSKDSCLIHDKWIQMGWLSVNFSVGLWKEAVGISQAEPWGLWCFDGSGEVCCACAARSQWHYERRTSPSGTLWGTGMYWAC